MNIQESMNILDAMLEDYEGGDYTDQEDAIRLGIEALKCVERMRSLYTSGFSRPLPGETKEQKGYYKHT